MSPPEGDDKPTPSIIEGAKQLKELYGNRTMSTPEEAARQIMDWVDRGAYAGTDQAVIVARAYLELVRRDAGMREVVQDHAEIFENLAKVVSPSLAITLLGDAKRARAALAEPGGTET